MASASESESSSTISDEFIEIINDFTSDLVTSYPNLKEHFDVIDYEAYYNYCLNIYPENFVSILYEYDDMFDNDECCYMLPNINFREIMRDEQLSDNSKKTIWKYLQLIMFHICNNSEEKDDIFGDSKFIFSAINEDDINKKIEETMEEMKSIWIYDNDKEDDDISLNDMPDEGDISFNFDLDEDGSLNLGMEDMDDDQFTNLFEKMKSDKHMGKIFSGLEKNVDRMVQEAQEQAEAEEEEEEDENGEDDDSDNRDDETNTNTGRRKRNYASSGDTMNSEKMKDKLGSLLGGKIGSLVTEIMEEAVEELGLENTDDLTPVQQAEFIKDLIRSPEKLMGIIKKIGTKIQSRLNKGDIKNSELADEAAQMMKNFSGSKEMMGMMKSMGLGGKGMDMGGMVNKMQHSARLERMRERLKQKQQEKERLRLTDEQSKWQNRSNEHDGPSNPGSDNMNKIIEPISNMNQIDDDSFSWTMGNEKPNTKTQTQTSNKKNKKGKGSKKKKGKK